MNKFLEAFANMFRVPDLRKRVLFTLGLLAVYRLGSQIPTPGINITRLIEIFSRPAKSAQPPMVLRNGPFRLADLRKVSGG